MFVVQVRPAMVLLMSRAVNAHMEEVGSQAAQLRELQHRAAASAAPTRHAAAPLGRTHDAEANEISSVDWGEFGDDVRSSSSRPSAAAASSTTPPPSSSSPSSRAAAGASAAQSFQLLRSHDPTVSYSLDGLPATLARPPVVTSSTLYALSPSAEVRGSSGMGGSRLSTAASLQAAETEAAVSSSQRQQHHRQQKQHRPAHQQIDHATAAFVQRPPLRPLPSVAAVPLQRRLAEITEMIHTASLLHDDVIDVADTRRGMCENYIINDNNIIGNKHM